MRRRFLRVAHLAGVWPVLLLAGCGGGRAEHGPTDGGSADAAADAAPHEDAAPEEDGAPKEDAGPEPDAGDGCEPTPVDVLYVVDTSPDMADARASLLSGLADTLDALTAGWGEHSLRVGVVSSDLGTGFEETCPVGGDDGVLHSDPIADAGGCEDAYPDFLDDPVDPDDIPCMAALPAEGCIVQRPADALLLALRERNEGFLRRASLLVLVIVGATEECSTDDEAVFDPDGGGAIAMRCYDGADDLTSAGALADRVTTVRRPSSLFLAALGGVPADLGGCEPADWGCLAALPAMAPVDGGGGVALPVCETGAARARPAPRLVAFLGALEVLAPDHVALGSICDEDWTAPFAKVGAEVGGKLCTHD